MKSLKKAKIAIIGGSGFEKLFNCSEKLHIRTPYGSPPPISIAKIDGKKVAFLPRHGPDHTVPPHKIKYRANIYALHTLGVERVIAVSAVGAINQKFKPADIVIPHDFIDFTKLRCTTFYDEAPVTHVDVSEPYCPEVRETLVKILQKRKLRVWSKAVLVCTEGPRFETPAEIRMFRRLGCDIVGMTGIPEAVLAREMEMCYASLCYVSNMAAGLQERLTTFEVSKVCQQIMPNIEQILIETVRLLPIPRKDKCPCGNALRSARFK